jgi:hypothetical protein
MDNFSLSDVAAVTRNNDYDGMGGSWWIILLFVVMFGWGGFGGYGGAGNGAITEAQMCNMNNFTQLENSVGRLADSQAQQNMMISSGICNLGYQNLEQFSGIQRDLCTGFANGVAATNAASAQAQQCCCDTNRNIDQLRYDGAMNTASINANTTAQTQKILDAICGNRMADMQNQINQLQLQNAVAGVVRYPSATTYATTCNPFFNNSACGCCGGNI